MSDDVDLDGDLSAPQASDLGSPMVSSQSSSSGRNASGLGFPVAFSSTMSNDINLDEDLLAPQASGLRTPVAFSPTLSTSPHGGFRHSESPGIVSFRRSESPEGMELDASTALSKSALSKSYGKQKALDVEATYAPDEQDMAEAFDEVAYNAPKRTGTVAEQIAADIAADDQRLALEALNERSLQLARHQMALNFQTTSSGPSREKVVTTSSSRLQHARPSMHSGALPAQDAMVVRKLFPEQMPSGRANNGQYNFAESEQIVVDTLRGTPCTERKGSAKTIPLNEHRLNRRKINSTGLRTSKPGFFDDINHPPFPDSGALPAQDRKRREEKLAKPLLRNSEYRPVASTRLGEVEGKLVAKGDRDMNWVG
ncbi:MAG: hypothetical protein M1812_002736 [Candelaria pacifica]|nr:MAG: hypothetical protein M1812_002736 [Candelaria pacifica]